MPKGEKDLMIAMIAHELRDPLVPLKYLAHLLGSKNFDIAKIGIVSKIMDRQVRALNGLIDDLLDLSNVQSGSLRLVRREAAMADIVGRALEMAGPLVVARGHTLSTNLPPAPIVLDADEGRLCQVLHNLIGNAAKYTACGGRIDITARRDGDEVELVVRDNGIGIAPADLEVIFEPYRRVRQAAATEPSADGLGIGLYIARHLVEAHGGTLSAASAGAGQGSELIVRLPCSSGASAAAGAEIPMRLQEQLS